MTQPLRKTVWRFLKKLGIKSPHDSATLLLGIYPEEIKTEKNTCTLMFIAALLAIAMAWKQPRHSLTHEWLKMLRYICTTENYSAIKRNTFESVLVGWMNLERIIYSEVS